MRPYTFGYLFVRLNKVLAILAVFFGLGWSFVLYLQHSFEAQAAAYSPTDELNLRLENLKMVSDKTEFKIRDFLGIRAFPAGFEAANYSPEIQSDYETGAAFSQLHKTLDQIDAARQATKAYLTQEFDTCVDTIRTKLIAHAQELDAGSTSQPVASATPQASTNAPVGSNNDNILFSSLSRDDVDSRKAVFSDATELFGVLQTAAESDENKAVLDRSIGEVSKFTNLLPVVLEVENAPEQQPDQPVKKVFNAEKVAAQLADLKSEVDRAVTSSWAVDEALDRATETYATESSKCREAEHEVKRIWRDCAVEDGITVVSCIGLAFALMVLADLTKAILDSAADGAIVAAAYTAVRQEESVIGQEE